MARRLRRRARSATRSAPRPTHSRRPASNRRASTPKLLLAEATGAERAQLAALARGRARRRRPAGVFAEMVRRRLRREPVAYILGRKGFRQHRARGRPPRPDPAPGDRAAGRAGAGARAARRCSTSGPARARSRWPSRTSCPRREVLATDTPRGARRRRARTPSGSAWRTGCASSRVAARATARSTCVLANLPYVSEREWLALAPELRDFEPRGALSPGPTGSRRSRRCWASWPSSPLQVAAVGLEVGEGQAGPVAELVRRAGFEPVEVRPDLAGIDAGGRRAPGVSDRLDRARRAPSGARGARADDRRRRRRGVPGRRPLRAGLRSAASRRDRANPRAEGPRRRQALGGAVLLAADPARAARQPRRAHPGCARPRCCPGPVTLVVAQPGARYPLACREDPARLGLRLIEGPLAGAATPLFQTSANPAASRRPLASTTSTRRSRTGADLAIDGGELDRRALDRDRRHRARAGRRAGGSCGQGGCRRPTSERLAARPTARRPRYEPELRRVGSASSSEVKNSMPDQQLVAESAEPTGSWLTSSPLDWPSARSRTSISTRPRLRRELDRLDRTSSIDLVEATPTSGARRRGRDRPAARRRSRAGSPSRSRGGRAAAAPRSPRPRALARFVRSELDVGGRHAARGYRRDRCRIAVGSDHAGLRAEGARAAAARGGRARGRRRRHRLRGVHGLPAPRRGGGALVAGGEAERAVLVCGSGVGVSIVANKVDGVRAVNARRRRRGRDEPPSQRRERARRSAGRRLSARRGAGDRRAVPGHRFEGGRHQRRVDQIPRSSAATA